MSKEKVRYFKIGLFAMSGMAILALMLIVFGAGKFFEKKIQFETYFDQSIQGLDVGAPVKYRGVKIGEVKQVFLVKNEYFAQETDPEILGKYIEYIGVRFAINAKYFPRLTDREIVEKMLDRYITKNGLRVKLGLIGITGVAYLELDYLDRFEETPRFLEIAWKPKNTFIPSTPHTFQRLDNLMNKMLDSLDTNFDPVMQSLGESSLKLPAISQQLSDSLQKFNVVMANLEEVTANAKKYPSQVVFGDLPPKPSFDQGR